MNQSQDESHQPLKVHHRVDGVAFWQAWLAESAELNDLILTEHTGRTIDVDVLLEEIRADRELRDESIIWKLDSQDR